MSVSNVCKNRITCLQLSRPKCKHCVCGRYEHAWATKLLWDTPSINTNRFRPILAQSRQILKNVHFCSFCSLQEPGGLFFIINGQKHFPRWPPTPLNRFQSILSTGTLWNVRIKCLQKPYQNRIKNVSCLQFVCKNSDSSTQDLNYTKYGIIRIHKIDVR